MADGFDVTSMLQIDMPFLDKLEHPDENTMLEIYNLYAKMLDPFVPMDEGVLAQSVQVSSDGLYYPGPYAHYQYVGDVYGPNFLIEDEVTGEMVWRSPKDKKKHPTGGKLVYSKEKHPLASSKWDKAMMEVKGEEFAQQVVKILMEGSRNGSR